MCFAQYECDNDECPCHRQTASDDDKKQCAELISAASTHTVYSISPIHESHTCLHSDTGSHPAGSVSNAVLAVHDSAQHHECQCWCSSRGARRAWVQHILRLLSVWVRCCNWKCMRIDDIGVVLAECEGLQLWMS